MEVTKVVLLVLLLLMLYALKLSTADCQGKCEQSSGSFGQPGIKHRAILGNSFKNLTVKKTFDCHVKCFDEKCRCRAYQMWNNRCELLDEDRSSAPDDFVKEGGYTYFDMNREFVNPAAMDDACSNQTCSNQCCKENPCAHGGTCTELCDQAKHKFTCTCTQGYYGKFCQRRRATSCKEHFAASKRYLSGLYKLFNPQTSSFYKAYCDFTSESGFVWTLIESFSLANNNKFADKAFYKDYPVNQKAFIWNKFRLSRSRMNVIAGHSTHVRATCNFITDGLNYTDYLRAKLSDIDVTSLNSGGCKKFEYINIRGCACHDCTAMIAQTDTWHVHVESYFGGCQLPNIGALRSEDNFGWYRNVNCVHRCSSNDDSTTQWWFGEQS